eukprot:scaffold22592_cov129-Cylindrotheca_fusiformis.AAC.37
MTGYTGVGRGGRTEVEEGKYRASIRAECIGGVSLFSFNDHNGKRVDHPSSQSLQLSKNTTHPPWLESFFYPHHMAV